MAVFESLSKLAPMGVPEAHVTSEQFDTILHDGLLEVYRDPVDGRYVSVRLVLPGEALDALCLPRATFTADALLPNE